MKLKLRALASTSALAVALMASPAAAQVADPATPPDPTVQAQEGPADPEAGSAETDDAVQTAAGQDQASPGDSEIVVTGLRRSLQSARNIKRNSEQIVDAIVAEDIGKLPDVTASAALARVPGVQVNRAAGEAAQVQIRGLPDLSTTYNGREIFTSFGRFVQIQDFPAGSVAALEVFKSSTANLIEGGLGGQVNVRSRKPFDFNGLEVSGSLNAVRFQQSGQWDWNGNILVSNRWDVGDGGEFGVLLNAAMTNTDFLDSTRENDLWVSPRPAVAGRPAFIAPNGSGLFYGSGDRSRPSLNGAVQYKVNSDLQFYADGLFQGYRGNDSNFWMFVPNFDNSTLTNVEFDENGLPRRYTVRSPNAPDGFSAFEKGRTNTYQVGGGVIYDATSDLRLTADIAKTKSTFKLHQINIDYALASSPDRDVVVDHENGPGGASFDFINFDTTDPANYRYRGLFQRRLRHTGDDIQARADAEWTTGWTNITRVQFGVRHNNRNAVGEEGAVYRPGDARPAYATLPISLGTVGCGFRYDNYQPERCFVGPSFDDVFKNADALRDFAGTVQPGGGPLGDVQYNPLQRFDANEKASAVYGQVKWEVDAGFPINGVLGLRAVRTKSLVTGTSRDNATGQNFDVTLGNKYTDFLPNASARLQFMPDLQLRLAYTQTRTRPFFGDLNPGTNIDPPPGICTVNPTVPNSGPGNPNCFRTAFGGNPNLAPINSNNLDGTLEYYFGRTGSATLAVFRRKLRGFVFRNTVDVNDPDFGRLRLNRPENAGVGKIRGFELGTTTFFDYDWLPALARGFGMQANYTYLKASTELGAPFNGPFPGQQDFPGVSKHAYNLVGMYERGPLTARLAYNWRSKFVVNYIDTNFGHLAPLKQDSLGQLDFSMSYTPIENITFAFDALNLLAGRQPIRTYRQFAGGNGATFPWGRKYLERVFSFGIRARLGDAGRRRAVAPPPVMLPPPPPPPLAPVVEPEPIAPPPPAPAPAGERG